MERSNLVGAFIAVIFLGSAILVFVMRLAGKPQVGKWIGVIELLLALPMIWLLLRSDVEKRSTLYIIQIGAVLLWLAVELLLDYILKIDFRQIRWMVITYVVLFFAAAGGCVGLAANAGKGWSITSIVLFFAAAVLAFVQRAVTGK